MTTMMPVGRNRRANGVSTDATPAGTSLSTRNRLWSQPTVPVLSSSAETPNSAAPRHARSPAVQAPGTRAGRLGHHHASRPAMVEGSLNDGFPATGGSAATRLLPKRYVPGLDGAPGPGRPQPGRPPPARAPVGVSRVSLTGTM